MLKAKRLMSIVLVLAMVVTMASFPTFASAETKIEPVGVTSPFTAGGGYSLKGTIDGSEAGNSNFFRANVNIASTGSKGNDANLNFVVDLGSAHNITEFYSAFGSKYATGVALWGSNDQETWTEIADLKLSAQRSTSSISHEGYYRYVKVEAYKTLDSDPAVLEVTFYGDSDPTIVKIEGLTAANVEYSGASLRNEAKQNMDTLFDGDLTRTPLSAPIINGIQFNWTPSTTVKTVEITLNNVTDICMMKLYWGNSDWNALPAQAYNVYFAGEDGTYGSAAYSYSDAATSQNTKSRDDVITFDTPVEAVKKIKIEITAHYTTGDPAIREIEITEKLDPSEVAWADYTVNYVDTEGNPMFDSKVITKKVAGRVVTETAEEVPGYKILEGNPQTITLVEGSNTITFTYEKLPAIEYTVKYVDENGNPLAPEKTGTAIAPYEVTEKSVYVDGYYKPATITKTLSETDKVIEFVYEAVPERMISIADNLLNNATAKGASAFTNNAYSKPEHVIDGDDTTYGRTWWSKTADIAVTIDLKGEYDINDMSLLWHGGKKTNDWISGDRNGAVRPTNYTVSVSSDGTNYTTVYTYNDNENTGSKDIINPADFSQSPKGVRYVRINTKDSFVGGVIVLYEVKVNGYIVTDRIVSAPTSQYYATGSTAVNFPITAMTLDPVSPESYFAAENWGLTNCTIESVTVKDVSDPASTYYTWDINVKVIPDADQTFFDLELDLPDSYLLTDGLSFHREASDLLFDTLIADGDNAIYLSKNEIVLNYKEDGTLTDESAKVTSRTINMFIDVQSVLESGLPYKGYDDIVIEIKEFKAKGDRVRYYLDEFVRVGDQYIASLLVTKAGVDQVEAVIGLYGVNADGTKVLLDTRTITSDLINIEAKYPVPKTLAQTLCDYTFPMDVLDQFVGYVHPADLPTFTDDEWKFFEEILRARGWKEDTAKAEIDRVRNLLEAELAQLEDPNWVPTKDYADDTVTIINRRTKANAPGTYERVIRLGTQVWNMLVDLHVESFSVIGPVDRPTPGQQETGFENDIIDAYFTFREGIDYNYGEKWTENTGFCIRMKLIGASAEYAKVTLGTAYNSVRRALGDDQVSPILFRADWYNWAKNPFNGGVITVELTEDWVENYGLFNLATYHMKGYKYSEDNDPELTLMEDGIAISNPFVREVSVTFEGAAAMYDTYVIVSTNKLPSELPEQIGVYYDVE